MSSLHAVLFAAHNTDLDLEKLVVSGGLGVEFLGDLHILGHRDGGTVPHVGLEQRILATLNALCRDSQQRTNELIESVLGAVVGVEGDGNAVVLGHAGDVLRQSHSASFHILNVHTGAELGTAGSELDDAVGLSIRKALQGGVDGLCGGAVDGRKSVAAFLCLLQHLGIRLGICNSHIGFLRRNRGFRSA